MYCISATINAQRIKKACTLTLSTCANNSILLKKKAKHFGPILNTSLFLRLYGWLIRNRYAEPIHNFNLEHLILKSSENPQKVPSNRTVLIKSSEISQIVLKKSSKSPQIVIRKSSDGLQKVLKMSPKVLRKSPESPQKVLKKSSNSQ